MAAEHKVLTYEQVTYSHTQDRTVPIEEGLNNLSYDGWTLVTAYPSKGYTPGCTTMFVFRRAMK